MNKTFSILLFILFISSCSKEVNQPFKIPGFEVINSGSMAVLNSISFSDEMHGIAVGSKGSILKTDDGGVSWDSIFSGTTDNLGNVCFVNKTTVFASGFAG